MRIPRIPRGQRLLAGLAAAGLIVVFCLALVRRNPGVFWNDDYQISILPVLADVARSWHEGHWPLLSPSSWACGNLAGEYQYGTFSVFVNVVVVVVFALWSDFATQAAALSIIHLAALGTGAYLLARGRRLSAALASVVALLAALNGWEISWGASDWFGALAADAWLPWAWWAFERAIRAEGDPGASRSWRLLPALFVYLVLTGGFPYTVVRLALVTAWLAARAVSARRWRALWPLVAGWTFGLMLSAPAWLSLLEYIRGSHRAEGAGLDKFAWTVPLKALPGLILPDWTVYWHDFANNPSSHAALELIGGFVPVAALAAACALRRGRIFRRLRWDLWLLGSVLLLCVLPSPGMFRWSFRWLPLFHLALALVGARALQMSISRHRSELLGNAGGWATLLAGAGWLGMSLARTSSPDAITRNLPGWTLGLAVGWMILAGMLAKRRAWALWVPTLAALASLWLCYTHMYTNAGVPKYGFGANLTQAAPLSRDRLYLSLYRAPFFEYWEYQTGPNFGAVLRPGSTGMFAGIHLINGYTPIMPPGVGRLWNMETHGSIPEDVGRRLLRDEAGPNGLLAELGVDGIIVAQDFPLENIAPPADEWDQVSTSAEGTVYHRRGEPLGAAHVETLTPAAMSWTPSPTRVRVVENSRVGITLDLDPPLGGRTAVYFHRPYFPGYVATWNGVSVAVEGSAGNLMPVVVLPGDDPARSGTGRLTLRYRPRAVVVGGAIVAVGLLALGGFAIGTRRRAGRE